MRINVLLTILLIFFAFGIELIAQKHEFTVLAMNGKCYVQKAKSKKWDNLKTGNKLLIEDKVKVEHNSYLGLMHTSGKTQELSKEGIYDINSISKKVKSMKSNITKKLTQVVIDELGSADDLIARNDYRTQMNTTGAVTRAIGGEDDIYNNLSEMFGGTSEDAALFAEFGKFKSFVTDNLLIARLPRDSYVIEPDVTFSWYPKKEVKTYTFYLTDRNGNILIQKDVNDTSISINLKQLNLKSGANYFWKVKGGDSETGEYFINWIENNAGNKDFFKDFGDLKSEIGDSPGAIDYLSLAQYYEENNVMNKAVESYEKALSLTFRANEFRNAYAAYLFRIGLVFEARHLLSN